MANGNPTPFRFSLRWLLAGTAYAAIGAGVFAQRSWVCAELLWAVAVITFCYSLLATLFNRGELQAMAIGFAVLWIIYVAFLLIVPHRVPSRGMLTLAGYAPPSPPEEIETYRGLIRGLNVDPRRHQPQNRAKYNALYAKYEIALGNAPEVLAANAIGTTLAGVIGCALGAFTFRQSLRNRR